MYVTSLDLADDMFSICIYLEGSSAVLESSPSTSSSAFNTRLSEFATYNMRLLPFLVLAVYTAAFYVTPVAEKPFAPQASITNHNGQLTPDIVQSTTVAEPPSVTFSSVMTIAPLSRNPLELRQKCWNDQGFSVNCATWTGYYYTWGGAGHPYAGGPGSGGGGSGDSGSSSNTAITGILGSANRLDGLKLPTIMAIVTICLLVLF